MKDIKKVMLISAVAFASSAQAKVNVIEANRYQQIEHHINTLDEKYGAKNVLVVFDIDNTLLTTGSSDLGGDIWYQWQTGKLPIKASKKEKVACLYSDTIPMLYQLLPMKLTEPAVKSVITDLTERGNTFFALSSRGPENRAATERELNKQGLDFSQHSLAPAGATQAPIYVKTFHRPTSYLNGVALTSGADKGKYLDFLLKKTARKFDALIFVDDGKHNIDAVSREFHIDKYQSMDTQLIHYTKVVDDRIKANGAVLTQKQADKMAQDWQKLKQTLDAIYPERAHGCMSK